MKKDEVISLFGKPDRVEMNGMALAYLSRGYTVFIKPQRGVFSFSCYSQTGFAIQVRDFAGKTSAGIGIGSSLEDLKAAFGVPSGKEESNRLNKTVKYNSQGLSFSLVDNKVVSFFMSTVRRADPE